MIEGYAECDNCNVRVGEGLIGLDDGDLKETITKIINTRASDRVCAHCGNTFSPTNPDQKYCDKECKTASYVNRALKSKEGISEGVYRALKNGKNGRKVIDL